MTPRPPHQLPPAGEHDRRAERRMLLGPDPEAEPAPEWSASLDSSALALSIFLVALIVAVVAVAAFLELTF